MDEQPFLGGYTPGFRGSVRKRMGVGYSDITHAVSRRSHHVTVCGIQLERYDTKYMHMSGNGRMETVTCVWCWVGQDPFP